MPSRRPDELSSTVRVTYFDREAVRRAVDAYAGDIAERHPEVDEIVLFGSVATGTPVPGSDVDLLLILTGSDRRFLDRIPQFLPVGFPVGVDVFPYTRTELEQMTAEGNTFVAGALRDGITVFRRRAGTA